MKGFRHVLMDSAGESVVVAATPAAVSATPPSGGAAPAAPQAPATPPAAPAAPAPNAGTALQAGAPSITIPEKYLVKKDDGTIDLEATSLRQAEGYANLVKRLGTDDAPPKTAEEYKVTPPEVFKDWKPDEDQSYLEFRKDAHAMGLSQKQFDGVIGKYFDLIPKLTGGMAQLSADDCIAELKTQWKNDAEFKGEMSAAYRAAKSYGDQDADSIIKDYGNDPRIVRMLARIGKEVKEDAPPANPGGTPSAAPIATLMASEAYNNSKHADHAKVSAQVDAHFAAQAAAMAKAGNSPLL